MPQPALLMMGCGTLSSKFLKAGPPVAYTWLRGFVREIRSNRQSPEGTSDHSPPRKRWACGAASRQAPQGRHISDSRACLAKNIFLVVAYAVPVQQDAKLLLETGFVMVCLLVANVFRDPAEA